MKASSRLLNMFLKILYPEVTCPVCRGVHPGICTSCRDSLKIYDEGCLDHQNRGQSLFRHQEEAQALVANFKKKMIFSAGDAMADLLFERCGNELKGFDLITFAPSSDESRKRLGFDHGKYLACALSGKTGVPVVALFIAAGKEQKVLDREERKVNAKNIRLRKGNFSGLKGKRVVLIDDVYTTGSTVLQCLELLEELNMECRYLTFSRL
ncbi:phosphoribosyltransferase family protein [Proteiniclasticum sp.]|uniref:ComF family protein n=1 Tax=Proteiniclasticum sp. TaxID=2053595 RepID=UPI00289D641D|nr:phosphoribosyltransferase family protein [Proteiniclasticum sp.]